MLLPVHNSSYLPFIVLDYVIQPSLNVLEIFPFISP